MILVAWSDSKGRGAYLSVVDSWRAFDCVDDAVRFYDRIKRNPRTYTASICGVIDSTDYQPSSILGGEK